MKRILFVCLLAVSMSPLWAQQHFLFYGNFGWPVYVELQEMNIPSFPAFHSGAVGAYDGKWFILGGRTNGLHGFYPPFAFPTNGMQNQLYVVDPSSGSVWSSGLDSLPLELKEQFSSSNMQSCVVGDKMYVTGGYGYSASQDEYMTFPYLTEVDLPSLAQAVISGSSPRSSFKFVIDSAMAVTGGRMLNKGNKLYLFFGHKFTGRYSSTPGPDFEQRYTYKIQMFNVSSTPDSIHIANYSSVTDSVNFRRRDLNVTHYVRTNGADTTGFMAWSGVFRADADRPHESQIFIREDGTYTVISTPQRYNQYHSAAIPLYSSIFNTVGVLFVGGMGEGQRQTTALDTLVPFVKNVSMMHDMFAVLSEEIADDSLDTYWGTNAEFIPSDTYLNPTTGMIQMNTQFCWQPHLIGYIVGGIESTGKHISSVNDPSLSFASNKIYAVYTNLQCESIDEYSLSTIQVFPNPSSDYIQVKSEEPVVRWEVVDISGKLVMAQQANGSNTLSVAQLNSGTYFIKLYTNGHLYRSSFIKR